MTGTIRVKDRKVSYVTMGVPGIKAMFDSWKLHLEKASKNELFRNDIAEMSITPPEGFECATSIIVAALETPPRLVPISYEGKKMEIVQPPQYYRMKVRQGDVKAELAKILAPGCETRLEEGYLLPAKYLAAWTGLGRYGRNNIIYVPGMGTGITLLVFWSDLVEKDAEAAIGAPRFLDTCQSCRLCAGSCPSGAIPHELGVIDVGRCVTLFNEVEGEIPEWIPPACFNASVGCIACQRNCPENAPFRNNMETHGSFDEKEVSLMLAGEKTDESYAALSRFLSLDDREVLDSYIPVIARNLEKFIHAQKVTGESAT